MKGLQGNMQYSNLQMSIINRLAEIEREDADRCESCGGEDCICCEYYIDRQKWEPPEVLFGDPMYDDYFYKGDEYDEEGVY